MEAWRLKNGKSLEEIADDSPTTSTVAQPEPAIELDGAEICDRFSQILKTSHFLNAFSAAVVAHTPLPHLHVAQSTLITLRQLLGPANIEMRDDSILAFGVRLNLSDLQPRRREELQRIFAPSAFSNRRVETFLGRKQSVLFGFRWEKELALAVDARPGPNARRHLLAAIVLMHLKDSVVAKYFTPLLTLETAFATLAAEGSARLQILYGTLELQNVMASRSRLREQLQVADHSGLTAVGPWTHVYNSNSGRIKTLDSSDEPASRKRKRKPPRPTKKPTLTFGLQALQNAQALQSERLSRPPPNVTRVLIMEKLLREADETLRQFETDVEMVNYLLKLQAVLFNARTTNMENFNFQDFYDMFHDSGSHLSPTSPPSIQP